MGKRQLLIVVSAPSGAGKTTLCDRLLAERPDIVYSTSCTTRAPRGAEVDGEDYHFLSAEAFEQKVADGAFLEHAEVHGNRYGTLRATVMATLEKGDSVLMDIDVQGAAQVRARLAEAEVGDILKGAFIDIFIQPPDMRTLRERLEGRGEDAQDTIERRLENARVEMSRSGEFRYQVVNDELERALKELKDLLDAEAGAS